MSRNRIVKECKMIRVQPGDILYVKLPSRYSDAKMKQAAENIHNFFHPLNVKVISGQDDLGFTVVRDET